MSIVSISRQIHVSSGVVILETEIRVVFTTAVVGKTLVIFREHESCVVGHIDDEILRLGAVCF